METFDEKQLLKAISEGDEKAFKTFFLYYYPRIKGFINGLLQSQEEAEDLSQDIFLTLWNNRSSLHTCLLYTSPSPRDVEESRMPSSA